MVELLSMTPEDVLSPQGPLARALSGYEDRPEQREMASAVWRTLREGGTLLVEAGPGTGKTFAYLVPSILGTKRVIVSTATKALQEQIYHRDLPVLARLGLPFRAAYMKGRENYLCLRRLEQFLQQPSLDGMEAELKEVTRWAAKTRTGDRSELPLPEDLPLWKEICSQRDRCLGADCPFLRECFVTRMRQRAAGASIVVVNHHLFMADLLVRDRGAELIPRSKAVIFDEAHHLEGVATEHFGLRVSNWRLEELARDAARLLGTRGREIASRIRELTEGLFGPLRVEDKEQYRLREVPPDSLKALGHLKEAFALLREKLKGAEPREEAQTLYRRAMEIEGEAVFILSQQDPDHLYWCETRGRGVWLHASPLDPSRELKARLYPRMRSSVFTSATLTVGGSFQWFKGVMGIKGGRGTEPPLPLRLEATGRALHPLRAPRGQLPLLPPPGRLGDGARAVPVQR